MTCADPCRSILDSKKVAIVHDYLNQYGGAERVLECLLEMFPEADLFTLLYDEEKTMGRFAGRKIQTSFLDFPLARWHHRFFIPLMPLATQSLNLGGRYDLIISATAGYAKGITYDRRLTKHLSYIYTPLRYAWEEDYLELRIMNYELRRLVKPILFYLRNWDFKMAQRPDKIITLSHHIAGKIKKYYGREAEVIYPPTDSKKFYLDSSPSTTAQDQNDKGEYYLAAGRLIHYKNFHIIIEAFNQLGWPLKIVGIGHELNNLKKMAKPNIHFLGFIKSDEEMRKLYNGARAFIFASVEDFGLVMAEAQACGAPVISLAAGGALEIIENGQTGIFFQEPTAESLINALKKFQTVSFDRQKISLSAQKFSPNIFKNKFNKIINDL